MSFDKADPNNGAYPVPADICNAVEAIVAVAGKEPAMTKQKKQG